MLTNLKLNPSDAWVIQRLNDAGHKIISVTKYPTQAMLDRKQEQTKQESIDKCESFRLKSLLNSQSGFPSGSRQTQQTLARDNQATVLAAIGSKPMRLMQLATHIQLSPATTKRHLDILVVRRKIYKDIHTKEFKPV